MSFLEPWRQLKALPRAVWLLSLFSLVNRAGTMVVPFLVLYLTRWLQLEPGRAGLLFCAYGVGGLLAAPLSGRLCDRLGAERVMAVSLSLSALVMLAYPTVTSPLGVALATVLLALTNETFRPASMTILGGLVEPAQRKQAYTLHRLAINLGMSIGPAVGGFLASWWFPSIFLVDGVTSLLAALGMWLCLGLLARPRTPEAPGPRLALHADRGFLRFLLAMFLVGLAFFQLDSGMPLYMVNNLGLRESDFGLTFTLNTFLILLLEVPLNARTNYWKHSHALAWGSLLVGLGFGSLCLVHSLGGVALTVVVWTCGEMILFPTQMAYINEVAPPGRVGEYMGLFSAIMGLAFMLAPGVSAGVLTRWGPYVLWPGTLVLALGAAALLVRLPGGNHPTRELS